MTPRRESGSARESELPFEQLMAEYQEVLRGRVQDQASTASNITRNYQHHIQSWLNGDQSREFENVLNDPRAATEDNLRTAQEEIEGDIADFYDRFVRAIPPEDQQIWDSIRREAEAYGPDRVAVRSGLKAASSRESREAMQAALDRLTWDSIRREAEAYGPDRVAVRSGLKAASSRESREAMQAALDRLTWDSIRREAEAYGPDRVAVRSGLKAASSRESREAMQAALDRLTWDSIRREAEAYGPDRVAVRSGLKAASSRESREAMERQLNNMFGESSSRSENNGFNFNDEEDFFRSAFGGSSFREAFEEEARRRRAGQGQQHTDDRQQQARQETPRRSQLDIEADRIIQQVVASDRQAGWLADPKSRSDVKRVIRTVRTIREKAAEKGEEMTDRKIYLRYRRRLEQNQDNVNPVTEKSFQILAAMMGYDPKGTLPF